ncbi:MAG: DUF192 domain-containing protein [Sedimenticola sp.]|nr:DUF192 domain-containing protein [Sedimenticola sp.]MCW8921122.1 DUF192 domain-containing protein [Sedimenticola sp.]MCW8975761.1 DUF192 domain-containing protein [Sedimenticola sp.]MCW9021544.1 DUF192 domain-containing protein [Sedimenticola sp.]
MKIDRLLLLPVLLIVSACGSPPPLLTIQVNNINARVEVAATSYQREQGLMYRQRLEKDQGLLMIFPKAQQVSLWMLNTPIPLEVGFFNGQGKLLAISLMQPDGGKQLYHSPPDTLYALEMNSGWFERYGLLPGAQLKLPEPIPAE